MLGYKAIWCDAIEVTRPYGVMLGFKAIWWDAGSQGHMVCGMVSIVAHGNLSSMHEWHATFVLSQPVLSFFFLSASCDA